MKDLRIKTRLADLVRERLSYGLLASLLNTNSGVLRPKEANCVYTGTSGRNLQGGR